MDQNRRSTGVIVPSATSSIEANVQQVPFEVMSLILPRCTYTETLSTAAKRLSQEARASTRHTLVLVAVSVLLSVLACWIAGGKCY